MKYIRFIFYLVLLTLVSQPLFGHEIGIFYFPGWTNAPTEWWNPPWEKIKPYPEREPLLGWYPEGERAIAEKHIQWMHDFGIDFVVYDWYWSWNNRPKLDHALKAYLRAGNGSLVQFSILWANHSAVPENIDQFASMVSFWIKNYFPERQYQKIDGKPVVYIFSPSQLRDNARKFNKSPKELLDLARIMARQSGYSGIYFVGCTPPIDYWIRQVLPEEGYDAVSGYVYQGDHTNSQKNIDATNYDELIEGYRQNWKWTLQNSTLPYFVPATGGWSRKPWGSNTPHDECISDPASFKKHLLDAKEITDRYPEKTKGIILIYAWNEYGEGSYIEPTKKWQFQYLQAIKDVFGK